MKIISKYIFKDQNRKAICICAAPYGLPLAAVSDNLGRVHLIDINNMSILRIIKGELSIAIT